MTPNGQARQSRRSRSFVGARYRAHFVLLTCPQRPASGPQTTGFAAPAGGAVLLGSLTLSVTEAIDAIGNHCEYRKSFPGSRLLAGKRTFPGAMREEMSVPVTKLSFWGVRGSTPTVDPATWRYGGNTPCLELVAPDGTQFILDCGTGLRSLGS